MKTLYCKGYIKDKYPLYISDDSKFSDLFSLLPSVKRKIFVIDQKVLDLMPEINDMLKDEGSYVFPINATEDNKTFDGLKKLSEEIFLLKPCRDDIIVAIGGGLIMNLAGLTASLVMRGIRFYYVPTTLTGQIDACIGSKQAVNFMGAKNWIGTYNDPEFCYINPNFLKTTPKYEMNSQAIEGVKLCLATNKKYFYETFDMLNNFYTLPHEQLISFIEKMVEVKLPIVEKDLLEENYGMSMLYGHTIGHAVEMLDHENINHGEAVGLGMLAAAKISHLLGLADENLVTIHEEILKRLEVKTKIPKNISPSAIEEMLSYNKKNYNGDIRFVLLKGIGEMAMHNESCYTIVPKDIVLEAIKACY